MNRKLWACLLSLLVVATTAYGLTINGQLKKAMLENLSSDPTGYDGRIYYNTTSKSPLYYNSGTWIPFNDNNATIVATDAPINLTTTSHKHQVFTGFTIARDVNLPATAVVGEIWILENITGATMIPNASGGEDLTVALGANIDASVVQGYVVLRATSATPTTAEDWRVVHVEEMDAITLNFNAGMSTATNNVSARWQRVNKTVTLWVPAKEGVTATATAITWETSANPILSRHRPSGTHVEGSVHTVTNNVDNTVLSEARVRTGGNIEIVRLTGTWTNGQTNNGFNLGFSTTWIVP